MPESASSSPTTSPGGWGLRVPAVRGVAVSLCAVAWGAGCASIPRAGAPAAGLVLHDPRGDDHGPGTYLYPQGSPYVAGSFDLTEVRLRRDGASLEVEATFARSVPMATVRLTADEVARLPVVAVDVYLDLDGVVGSGRREALPGRQVRLAQGRGWEAAIVLHPTPTAVEGLYDRAARDVAVWVPRRVRVQGRSLRARVPRAALEGHALRDIGVAAAVTGVVFGASFRAAVDGATPTSFVREITAEPGQCGRWDEAPDGAPCTFGGCRGCGGHPRVIDALASTPGVQERALSLYDTSRGAEGELPVVGPPPKPAHARAPRSGLRGQPPGPAPPRGAQTGALRGEVRGQDGATLTAWFPGAAPVEGALGQALDAGGATCGQVVVIERLGPRLVLLRALGPLPTSPATVRFPRPR